MSAESDKFLRSVANAFAIGDTELFSRARIQYVNQKALDSGDPWRIADIGTPFVDPNWPMTFEAPRFSLIVGSEIGYHAHVLFSRNQRETGLLVTVTGNDSFDVYAEHHRKSKVRPVRIGDIGKWDINYLVEEASKRIGRFPIDARRRPSKNAQLLGSIAAL